MSADPPEALKKIKPYLTLATQLEAKKDPIIAYYCRLYAIKTGMVINKSAPECKKFLMQLMDLLEQTKSKIKSEEAVQTEMVGQAVVENYAIGLFEAADADDRAARFSQALIKQFYSAGLLFDVLTYFGELKDDVIQKQEYAKKKAVYIKLCLQNGETPVSGPLLSNEGDDTGAGASAGGPSNSAPYPIPQEPQSPQMPTNQNKPSSSPQAQGQTSTGKTNLPVSTIMQAEKLCKFAASALQYEDISAAIENLEKCLALLKK